MAETEQVIDALPYYDRDAETYPGLRSAAEREIASELAKLPTSKQDNVAPLANPSFTPLLQTLYDRTSSTTLAPVTDGLQLERYNRPLPSDDASIEEWERALEIATATLGHQANRQANVELLNKFGSNAWRISNYLLEKDVGRFEREIEETKTAIESLNRKRKTAQLNAGEQLTALEQKWTALVSGNLQLEVANIQLEIEVERLRARENELEAKLATMD